MASRPTLPPHEADVYRLLQAFEDRVSSGQQLSFGTFRTLWRDMHFSCIFEVMAQCYAQHVHWTCMQAARRPCSLLNQWMRVEERVVAFIPSSCSCCIAHNSG